MTVSTAELRRYARQIVLPGFGTDGQERLRASSVLVVGLGGLGSPAALYLAAAGIGRLGLVDADRVDESNLHRQILHGTPDLGLPKTESARARLAALNPHVTVDVHPELFSAANAVRLVRQYDVILDATDNFGTRYGVNDACVLSARPNVYASVHRMEGQLSVFAAHGGPCYRCRCSPRTVVPATAVCIPNRRRTARYPTAPRAGCWGWYRGSSAPRRPPKPSS